MYILAFYPQDKKPPNNSVFLIARAEPAEVLRDLDSNQDIILQRDAYYLYTIPQYKHHTTKMTFFQAVVE